jgi:transcriptional activator HAC1
MASWDQQTSPLVKFENSPAESFMSAPGDMYPSLFAVTTPTATTTMNPLEIMTPRSYTDDKAADASVMAGLAAGLASPSAAPSPSSEKKAVKKRKSWGQVLPEPKTNLPPR